MAQDGAGETDLPIIASFYLTLTIYLLTNRALLLLLFAWCTLLIIIKRPSGISGPPLKFPHCTRACKCALRENSEGKIHEFAHSSPVVPRELTLMHTTPHMTLLLDRLVGGSSGESVVCTHTLTTHSVTTRNNVLRLLSPPPPKAAAAPMF